MKFHLAVLMVLLLLSVTALADDSSVLVRSFLPVKPISRAMRPAPIRAVVANTGETPAQVLLSLTFPEGVRLLQPANPVPLSIDGGEEKECVWEIEAKEPMTRELALDVSANGSSLTKTSLSMSFLPAVEMRKLDYIPEPQPVRTDVLIGAHHCPLWEADKPFMWSQLIKHPERTPALGFYAQENPEVSDWETKWASEHGISFFVYCWYRVSQGKPVETRFSSAIHEALFKSKFVDKMKFTIMWENQSRGTAGVSDENDLMANLLPFWMENYFKHPSYVKIDNKPLLFIYRPEFLIDDLGSEQNVVKAFDLMRNACKDAGFDGLYLLGEYRGLDPEHLKLMKRIGLDYTFAYCWHVQNNPTPEQAIAAQVDYINKTQQMGIMPQVVTVSQAWSGWRDEGTIWKIPPDEFRTLLKKAKDIIATFPANELGSKVLLLDNWNEWGEGHYIAPYREYGFGYVDAVREVFSDAVGPHEDLIPEDIGMGPYDAAYWAHMKQQEDLKKHVSQKVMKGNVAEQGLVAWWAFDEEMDSPVAFDYSGHRLGGIVREAKRTAGIDGNALVCDGGCVEVPKNPSLSIASAMTVTCWIKTDQAGQANTWIANRVLQGGTHTGYRLGVVDGKPCFEIPVTEWSHHLKADIDLPTGRWVYLAGTFDGKTMRIFVDGEEHGKMNRPGPINPNDFHLVLGNYDVGHNAHFAGLLDEVKVYDRALSAEEIRAAYQALAGRG